MSAPTLLHLCTPAEWRAALADGALGLSGAAGRSMAESGFVHLSTAEQVALPATRLFAGRDDIVALAVDAGRIADLRWEPGLPEDPSGMVFPHAYGPVPTGAVVAVLPFRPRPDGGFDAPGGPPARVDAVARRDAMAYSVLRRLATSEQPVTAGVAVVTDAVSASYQHNQLLLDGPVAAAQVISDAEHVLGGAGLAHRAATLRGVDAAATAAELGRHGWEVDHLVSLVTTPSAERSRHRVHAERALPSELRAFWEASWLRSAPGLTEEQRAQLSDRHELEDDTVDVHAMAIREHGLVVACCLLKIDGATAELDAVETAPTHRGRGLGDALLAGALRQARQAGCDLVWLDADAADWPRDWYRRRGFGEVGESWFCRRRA